MKKITILALGLLVFSNSNLLAQDWKLGGNTVSSSQRLGTNNNYSLIFETNGSDRGRITGGGNWGIGLIDPLAKLHVNSTVSGQIPFRVHVLGSTKFLVNSAGNVGIGTSTPSYKLQVVGNASISNGLTVGNGGIFGYNSSGAGVYGSGSGWGLYGTSPGIGVYGTSTASSYGVYGNSGYIGVYGNGTSYGLYGNASTSSGWGVYGNGNIGTYGNGSAYGAYGIGGSIGIYGTGPTYAVYGNSTSGRGVYGYSTNGIGGYFYSANHYGLWAATGRSDNYYAAVFDGNTYSYNSYLTSDKNLKQKIEEFGGALSIINKLKPKYYEFRHDGKFASLNLPTGRHYGLLAQEVEEVLPNLVKEAPHPLSDSKPQPLEPVAADGKMPVAIPLPKDMAAETPTTETVKLKAVNYTELITIMIRAMQEQQQTIQQVQQENNALKERLTKLETALGLGGNIKLNSTDLIGVSLEQNHPNPFNQITTFRYSIPTGTIAQIVVYNSATGKLVKTLPAPATGQLEMNVSDLEAGTYIYSLVVNGKLAASKQMVLSK